MLVAKTSRAGVNRCHLWCLPMPAISPLRHACSAFRHLFVAWTLGATIAQAADADAETEKWYRDGREALRAGTSAESSAKARELINKAASAGHAKAQCELGVMLMEGRAGVPVDRVTAYQWFERAAAQGDAVAQTNLGWMKANGIGAPKNMLDAAQWYRRAAESGSAEAQARLGDLLARGPDGLPRSPGEAAKWLTKAAERGNASAQNTLGVLYENGNGAPKDIALAVNWLRLAAEQGHARAQANLGRLYEAGKGVERDPVLACYWLVLSANQNEINAKKYLEELLNQKRVTSSELAEGRDRATKFQPKEKKDLSEPAPARQRSE